MALALARAARLLPGASARARFAHAAERRALERAVRALGRLKGPFVKLGQFGAIRLDALPADMTARAQVAARPRAAAAVRAHPRRRRERARTAARARVRRVRGDAARRRVDRAGASRALPDGTPVVVQGAVPVARASLETDLRIANLLLVWSSARRGSVDGDALFREFGEGVREELDFAREARVAARSPRTSRATRPSSCPR
jgi:predicted unusual protein kinase regulating ubiquinone biosynthesis (AarF/ABC1/UbiB family)